MSYKWFNVVLALSSLGAGPVWAESAQDESSQVQVVQPLVAGDTRIEVTSTRGLKSGSWILVQPKDEGASWPWELVEVQVADEQHLELHKPLVGAVRAGAAQATLLVVARDSEGNALQWLDSPRQGTVVSDGALAVEGQASRGAPVVVFVDGVEKARFEADESGWFAGSVEMPRAPGSHQVQVVREVDGTWTLYSEPVTVVTLAPPAQPVVLEPASGTYTKDTTPLFRGTGQATSKVIVSIGGTDLDSTDVDTMGNWSLSLSKPLAEGVYSVSFRAQWSSGESSASTLVNIAVDVTPPQVQITDRPPSHTSQKTATFRFQSTEFSSFECSFEDSPFTSCRSPYNITTPLADGRHAFAVRATDRAGNVQPEPTRHEWLVDTVPPTVEIISRPPPLSNQDQSIFKLKSSKEVERYECVLDGTALRADYCGETTVAVRLAHGPHTLKVHAIDVVGLVGPEAIYSWMVDLKPPAVPVLLQPATGSLLNAETLDISGTAEPGSTVTALLVGNKGNANCSATADASGNWSCKPTSPLATDSYQLTLEARDEAGNVSEQFTPVSFDVDVDDPDTFLTEGPEAVIQSASPKFGFRSNEEGVTFECSVGEESFGSCDALVNGTRSFEQGSYTLRARARDRAGNVDDTPVTQTWVYSLYQGNGGGLSGCAATGASPLLPLVPLLAFLKRRRSRSSPREVAGCGGLLALVMAFLAGPARAQGVDLQQYEPAPGSRDVLGVYSPQVAPGLGLHAGLSVSYARNPLVLRNASDGKFVQSIVSDQLTADVLASISFLNHFELGLALPVTGQWGPAPGNLGVFIPENATGTGVGDLRLVPKAVLSLGDSLSLGAAAVLSLPTAGDQSFRGAGGVGVQPMLLAQWAASEQLRVLANVGGRFQPERQVALLGLTVGNELSYALGAHWSPANSKLFVQGSLEGAVALSNQQSGGSPLELLAAVGYSLSDGMSVRLGGGPGLTSGYGTPNFRLFASIAWSPASSGGGARVACSGKPDMDDDKDGVLNAGDLCPYEQGERGDGCPKDGSSERVSALAQLFKNDSDKDGLLDDVDACPSASGDRENQGCPSVAQSGGKESESFLVTFASPAGKPEVDAPGELEKVVKQVQALLNSNQLAAVHVRFLPLPKDEKGAALVQQRAERMRDSLAQHLPELKGSDKLKVEFNGKPARRSGKKDLLDVDFTLVRASAQPQPLKCAEQGIAARLVGSYGEVTAGAENKQEKLANEGQVCDGEVVKTGPDAGAVLVLADGNVLRLAPESQVKLSRSGVQSLQGAVESQGNSSSLAAPEILPPCSGSSSSVSWEKVSGARRYWVQVARGVDFNSDLRSFLTERRGLSLKLPAGGKWYWRVLPVDGKGLVGQPSRIYSFDASEAVRLGN